MTIAACIMTSEAHAWTVPVLKKYYEKWVPVYVKECNFLEKEEHVYRNEFSREHPEVDFWLCPDTDEVFLKKDMEKLIASIKGDHFHTYGFSFEHYVAPTKVIRPIKTMVPTVAYSKWIKFIDKRCSDRNQVFIFDDTFIHHLYFLHDKDRMAGYEARGIAEKEKMIIPETLEIVPPEEVQGIYKELGITWKS